MEALVTYSPVLGAMGLLFAGILYMSVVRRDPGTERMQAIANQIHDGNTLDPLAVAPDEPCDDQERDHAAEPGCVRGPSQGSMKGRDAQQAAHDSKKNRAMAHEDFEIRIVEP